MPSTGRTNLSTHDKTLRMTQLAILTAVTIFLSFFMIPIAIFELTLAMLPVAVGAVLLGPLAGLFLGTVFGISSFITCFGLSPLGVMLLGENAFFCFLVCVPTRALMGLLVGLIYRGLHTLLDKKITNFPSEDNAAGDKKLPISLRNTVPVTVASFSAPILNTLFFLGAFVLFFVGGSSWQALETGNNVSGVFEILLLMTGLNALVELLVSAVVGSALMIAVLRFQKAKHRF